MSTADALVDQPRHRPRHTAVAAVNEANCRAFIEDLRITDSRMPRSDAELHEAADQTGAVRRSAPWRPEFVGKKGVPLARVLDQPLLGHDRCDARVRVLPPKRIGVIRAGSRRYRIAWRTCWSARLR